MIGEGEDTFRELCGYYAHKRKMSDIAGIAFRKNSTGNSTSNRTSNRTSVNNAGCKADEIVFTSPRPIKNMSEIPFCYDTLDDFSKSVLSLSPAFSDNPTEVIASLSQPCRYKARNSSSISHLLMREWLIPKWLSFDDVIKIKRVEIGRASCRERV
mgnify:CR=1 FL=1